MEVPQVLESCAPVKNLHNLKRGKVMSKEIDRKIRCVVHLPVTFFRATGFRAF